MYIITLPNGLVMTKTSNYSLTDKGFVLNHDSNTIYGFTVKVFEVEAENIPPDLAYSKYFYTEENGFELNPDFVAPEEPVNMEEKLLAAEAKIAELEDALCELSTIVEEVLG